MIQNLNYPDKRQLLCGFLHWLLYSSVKFAVWLSSWIFASRFASELCRLIWRNCGNWGPCIATGSMGTPKLLNCSLFLNFIFLSDRWSVALFGFHSRSTLLIADWLGVLATLWQMVKWRIRLKFLTLKVDYISDFNEFIEFSEFKIHLSGVKLCRLFFKIEFLLMPSPGIPRGSSLEAQTNFEVQCFKILQIFNFHVLTFKFGWHLTRSLNPFKLNADVWLFLQRSSSMKSLHTKNLIEDKTLRFF